MVSDVRNTSHMDGGVIVQRNGGETWRWIRAKEIAGLSASIAQADCDRRSICKAGEVTASFFVQQRSRTQAWVLTSHGQSERVPSEGRARQHSAELLTLRTVAKTRREISSVASLSESGGALGVIRCRGKNERCSALNRTEVPQAESRWVVPCKLRLCMSWKTLRNGGSLRDDKTTGNVSLPIIGAAGDGNGADGEQDVAGRDRRAALHPSKSKKAKRKL
ncbi:uncharacterized protein K489DRAFT_380908 [Dissoconium aciculare CBS 342.82]|uniref:Uncharacterized protein n=1 Tax=Dissoconium aciculare CBS 342.82 TaxID=1314786 RepID=A0A6J3M3W2_9PEZI|nr:uncharacterized protein K489DRAFT_380908 [Dissoconium aciculare CBS 342.82]KAF1822169.1 hypothetical protein K489DRAFT_380908 [Dissoconium aciculare CBS 342.82]